MKIVSCNGFVKKEALTVILMCHIKLFSYYLSKVFVMIEKDLEQMRNMPRPVKYCINAEDMYGNDLL